MNYNQRIRARIVYIAILIASLGLAVSLYMTEIVKGPSYLAKADKQYIKPTVSLFDRGTIFFTAKDGTKAAAAAVGSGYLIYMNPSEVTNPSQVYDALFELVYV